TEPGSDAPASRLEVAPGPAWPLVVTVQTRSNHAVAGADVRVWVAARGIGIENQTQGEGMPEEVARGATAADGTFRCALDPYRKRSPLFRCTNFVFVTASLANGCAADGILDLPRTTEPRRFAVQIELERSIGIVGRVVDGKGQPVAGARFRWRPPQQGENLQGRELRERSGDDGSFCIAMDAGDPWFLRGSIVAVEPSRRLAVASP